MYSALFGTIRSYWHDYGGFREWLQSPFVHFSVLVTALYMKGVVSLDWEKSAITSLPTVLGFSLAAYTITFTLMGSALHRALSTAVDEKTGMPLIRMVNATFFHVVFFQAISLIYATLTGGTYLWDKLGGKPGFTDTSSALLWIAYNGGRAAGCFLSVYSFTLLFSVCLAMFRLGKLSTKSKLPEQKIIQDVHQDNNPPVTDTFRFKIVKTVARILRIYK